MLGKEEWFTIRDMRERGVSVGGEAGKGGRQCVCVCVCVCVGV